MYLSLRGAEEGTQGSMIVHLWLVGAIVGFHRPGSMLECEGVGKRNEEKVGVLYFNFLKRQLHIFFVIIIIEVIPAVMHSHEIEDADVLVQRFVLYKMLNKRGELQNLIQGSCIKNDYCKDDM